MSKVSVLSDLVSVQIVLVTEKIFQVLMFGCLTIIQQRSFVELCRNMLLNFSK